jgi:pyridoxine kinase
MKQILSIQSSVTLGFVGNRVAAPVLTAMGHHPLAVDTIALAAHPGYGSRSGGVPANDDFTEILGALSLFDALGGIDFVITGYLGTAHQASPIKETLNSWRRQVSGGVYILDPVLGDSDNLYVKPQIAESLQAELLPLADIITPNRFELGFLAGCDITDLDSAIDASQTLMAMHPRLGAVVATGISREAGKSGDIGDLLITENDAPLWLPASDGGPLSPKNIPGGGDLLTAIMTGNLARGMDLVQAAGNASRMTQRIIANSEGTRDLALMEQLHLLSEQVPVD